MGKANPIEKILQEYKSRLTDVLGEQLDSLIVYGSQARRDAEPSSDIDVLCVMKSSFDYGDLLDRTSQATAEISLKYEVVLSRTFVTSKDYSSRKTPFLINVRREGISL